MDRVWERCVLKRRFSTHYDLNHTKLEHIASSSVFCSSDWTALEQNMSTEDSIRVQHFIGERNCMLAAFQHSYSMSIITAELTRLETSEPWKVLQSFSWGISWRFCFNSTTTRCVHFRKYWTPGLSTEPLRNPELLTGSRYNENNKVSHGFL